MDKDKLDDVVFKTAIDTWGWDEQSRKATEECGELIAAINQYRMGRITKEAYMKEVVDTYIMTRQLRFADEGLFEDIYSKTVDGIRRKLKLKES